MVKISIIIPCFNHGQYITEAIQSVEEYPDKSIYEIIIVNDGSTDEYTNDVLLDLNEAGYNVILQSNQGLGKTRNNGIRIAQGEYILPLDADNKISTKYITRSIEILDSNANISVVYGDAEFFEDKNGIWKVGDFDMNKLLCENFIDACAVFRKSDWLKCGGYSEDMPFQGWEDWDFWLKLSELKCQFYYVPEVMFFYRVTKNSMITHIINDSYKQKYLNSYIFYRHLKLYSEYSDPIISHAEKSIIRNNLIQKYLLEINNIKNSPTYKIGKFIVRPFSILKRLFIQIVSTRNYYNTTL